MTGTAGNAGTTSRWRYLARLVAEARQATEAQDATTLIRLSARIERHARLALKDHDITMETTTS